MFLLIQSVLALIPLEIRSLLHESNMIFVWHIVNIIIWDSLSCNAQHQQLAYCMLLFDFYPILHFSDALLAQHRQPDSRPESRTQLGRIRI